MIKACNPIMGASERALIDEKQISYYLAKEFSKAWTLMK
jgi:hypothetical protein